MTNRRLPVVLASIVYLAQVPFFLGYTTDDSAIYARFAHNLAARGELAFNPGEAIHAATSPLWAGLGAVGVLLGADPIVALRWLGIVLGLGTVMVLAALGAARIRDRGTALLFACVVASAPWTVRWSQSGMETPLATVLVAFALFASLSRPEKVSWRCLGLAVGVLPLVRPEALLLVALFAAYALCDRSVRPRADFWVSLLLPSALWTAVAIPLYGHPLPATLQAKSTPLGFEPERILANLRVLASIYAIGALVPTVAWVLGWGGSVRRSLRAGRVEAVWWLWTLALPLVYLARDVQVVSRYLEIVLPVVTLLGVLWLTRWKKTTRSALGAQVVLALVLTLTWIAPSSRSFGRSLDAGLGDIAEWLVENSDEDALVAIYDVGVIAHRSDRRILDLGGLVHPEINDLRNEVDDAEILEQGLFLDYGTPDFLVDRDTRGAVLDGRVLGGRVWLEKILSREVANLGLSRAEPVLYTLYRVHRLERLSP